MRRPATSALLALALGAVVASGPACPPPARAQTSELPEELRTVADVRFTGMHALGKAQLKAANLHTRRPSRLPWRERPTLRRDYLRADSASVVLLYRHYGFLDATVNVRVQPMHDPRSARVVFAVHEGKRLRISSVELAGVTAYPEADLRRALLARPGEAFDPAFVQLDLQRIQALYRERGYFVTALGDTTPRGVPDSLHRGVRYVVHEGPQYRVGNVDFPAQPHVRASLGKRELLLRPGDVYSESRLSRSLERLYQTNLWSQVQPLMPRDTVRHIVDIGFRALERKRRWVDGGVGSGTSDLMHVTGELGHRNLDTRALSGVLDGELAYYFQNKADQGRFHHGGVSAALTEPWLFGIRLQGQVGVFDRQANDRIYKSTDESVDPIFVQYTDSKGVHFSLLHELGRSGRLTLTEENAFVREDYVVLSDTAKVTSDSLAATVVSSYFSNTLRLTLEHDLRNDRIAPTRGSYQEIVGELAGGPLHGRSSYDKGVVSSTWYIPTPKGWALAARVTGGVMNPLSSEAASFVPELGVDEDVARVPLDARFHIGGVNSLRGYGENAIPPAGGLAMALANVEVRIPLAGPLGLEIFMDSGNVWARPTYVKAGDFVAPWQATRVNDSDLRYTYGIGGRLVLPFGPLRVDLAWSDRPDFPRINRSWNLPGGGSFKLPFVFQFAIGPSF